MTVIPVALDRHAYDVVIERGALSHAAKHLGPTLGGRRALIVTDGNAARFVSRIEAGLPSAATLVLPPGEATKSWRELERVCDWLLDQGVERGDHVIAVGGGVIGDLAGFAAAIVKRGCGLIQIPTTLLAQVDSSVGGKTAIDVPSGKNLIGAFHQPALVLIDPDTLDTLPPRELRAGYAEIVKYGLIDDPDFFAWCEANGAALLAGDPTARDRAIAHSVAAKARIVAADELETSGVRALLNLGHTFGHALEAEAGFSGRLLHGEAVAAGIALSFDYSVLLGLCPARDADRVKAHWRAVGLPDGIAATAIDASGAVLVGHMHHDKKAAGGRLPFLLARGIGQTFLARDIDLTDVERFLDERLA